MVKIFGKQKAESKKILKYSLKPEKFLSDLRKRDETALELGSQVIKLLISQIAQEKDPSKASLLVSIALECGLSRADDWMDMRLNKIFLTDSTIWEINVGLSLTGSPINNVEKSLTGTRLGDECQKTIVDALKAGERLDINYLILFVRLARQMSKESANNPVPALVNLLHLASEGGGRDPDWVWIEVARTLLALGVQDTVESIIEHIEVNNAFKFINLYTDLSQQVMRTINIKDAGTLKRFMASKSEHVRRFVLTQGCLNRETIWKDEESQKCLESVYSSDSNHTCTILAAFALVRSGRKDLTPFLLEILKDPKFSVEFRDSDEVKSIEERCVNLLCSLHESKALPIFIRKEGKDFDKVTPIHICPNNLSESLLDNANYMHFPGKDMAELLCLLLERANLDYINRLSHALIMIGDRKVIDRLVNFSSSDERRLVAAFKALAGLNETERLVNVLLNSEVTRAAAAGNALSSITGKSLIEKIVSNYQPKLPWGKRKALIMSLRSSKETLTRILEIEKDFELRRLIEEKISD